jgi:hypothetical protein
VKEMTHSFKFEYVPDEHHDALLDESALEQLADFYHRRDFYEEAIATLEELIRVRSDRESAVTGFRLAS